MRGRSTDLAASEVACCYIAVQEFANKSAASAASLDYVKFQAVIKSAASAASLCGGRASGHLDQTFFWQVLAVLAAKNSQNLGLCYQRV